MTHLDRGTGNNTGGVRKGEPASKELGRRSLGLGALAGLAGFMAAPPARGGLPEVRLGILQFGTVQWISELIRDQRLDAKNGFTLRTVKLANNAAGRIALMARAVDIAVSDWIFVASQRAAGTKLQFAPFSDATGGVVVPAASPVQSLADLAHRKLGVAGGPLDKSWLIARAAAQARNGIDLSATASIVYGAPPLLSAKLLQGELDAALTYWNFAARLEASGCREVVSVADCARALGIAAPLSLVGFVFHEDWAKQRPDAIDGFLRAVSAAETLLRTSNTAWQRIRPLMDAPNEALFQNLKRRFMEGIVQPAPDAERAEAETLFAVLLRTGGPRATGGVERLPNGVFWRASDG